MLRSVSKMKKFGSFAILDMETNGLPSYNFNKVNITELCIYAISSSNILSEDALKSSEQSPSKIPGKPRIVHKLNLLFNPKSLIKPDVVEVTGLCNYSLENESCFDLNAATMIVNFLKHLQQPVCLVAHNGWNFDFPILKEKLDKFNLELPEDLVCVDTYAAFLDIDQERKKIAANEEVVEEALPELESLIDLTEDTTSEKEKVKDLLDVLKENDAIDWKTKNETTPKSQVRSDLLSKKKQIPKRRLSFSESPAKIKRVKPTPGQYKLGNIYRRLFEQDITNAHEAEADVMALLKLIQHYGADFVSYAHKYARSYDEILKVGQKWQDF